VSAALKLDDLSVPLRVLRLLMVDFGHLPAPTVSVSPIYPSRLELALHSGLPGFEAWREALDATPDAVTYTVQRDGRTQVLRTLVDYAGAELELVGYGDLCAPVLVGAA
jgi:hypothetical protein